VVVKVERMSPVADPTPGVDPLRSAASDCYQALEPIRVSHFAKCSDKLSRNLCWPGEVAYITANNEAAVPNHCGQ